MGGAAGQGGEDCAGGEGVLTRDWEACTLRRAGAVEAACPGDDGMGRLAQGEDRQEAAIEDDTLQAGAEEYLEGEGKGGGTQARGDDGRGVGLESGGCRDDTRARSGGLEEYIVYVKRRLLKGESKGDQEERADHHHGILNGGGAAR